jgi:hypothetical protein
VWAYKAFDKNMKCKGFQFKEGEEYTHNGKIEICKSGYHACENPLDVLNYYNLCDSVFCKVEATGNVQKHSDDTKICTDKIKIGLKISLPEFIKAGIDFVFEKCKTTEPASSGDSAKLASSGHSAKLASSGHSAQLASSGDSAQLASSGDSAKLARSGHSAQVEGNGKNSIACGIGKHNAAKGALGTWIVLSEFDDNNIVLCVKSVKVDGKKIKANTWYSLQNRKFVEKKQ